MAYKTALPRIANTAIIIALGVLIGAVVDAILGLGYNEMEALGAGLLSYNVFACIYLIRQDKRRIELYNKLINDFGIKFVQPKEGETMQDAIKREAEEIKDKEEK